MAAFVSAMTREVRGRELAGRMGEADMKGLDWLAVAIGNLGGVARAASTLHVQRQTVYNWLNQGLGNVEFSQVVEISKAGDVPLEYLARRLGPFDGELTLPKRGNGVNRE